MARIELRHLRKTLGSGIEVLLEFVEDDGGMRRQADRQVVFVAPIAEGFEPITIQDLTQTSLADPAGGDLRSQVSQR